MTTEEIILNKSWKELTAVELAEIRELAADEASFNHMKSFMQQIGHVSANEVYEPSVSVKSGLDAVFTKQHAARMPQQESTFKAPSSKIVPLYQRNWTKIAAAVIFVATSVIVWTWPGRQEIAPGTRLAKMDEPVVFSNWNPEKEKQKQAEAPAPEEAEKVNADAARTYEVSPVQQSSRLEAAPTASSTRIAPNYFSEADQSREMAKDYSYGYKNQSDTMSFTAKTGRNADLFPDSFYPSSVAAASEDLLSYIKPAF